MERIVMLALVLGMGAPALATGAAAQETKRDRPAFGQVDADGDGAITAAEWATFRMAGAARRFARLDADGDGRVTRAELEMAGAARVARRAEVALKRLDANGDGAIELEEMSPRRGGARAEGRADRMFGRVDADGDGRITRTEWDAAATRRVRN